MAGVAVRVLAGGAVARLVGMEARGGNLTGVLRSFGQYMLGSIEKNFAAGGRPKWPPLKLSTLLGWSYGFKKGGKYRTKRGGPTKAGRAASAGRLPLTASGLLRRSVRVAVVTPRSVTIGTSSKYAAIHQFGGMAGRGRKVRIPARPYLLFQNEDVQRFTEMMAAHVVGGK
jgi:phage gpG-like protein